MASFASGGDNNRLNKSSILLMLLLLDGLALASDGGSYLFVASAFVSLVVLSFHLYSGTLLIRLSSYWHFGFILIVCLEGILYSDAISAAYGEYRYNEASRYLVAANASFLVASYLISSSKYGSFNRHYLAEKNETAKILIVVLSVLYIVYHASSAFRALYFGRSVTLEREKDLNVILEGVMESAGIVIPAAFVYLRGLYRNSVKYAIGAIFILPILVIQIAIGTRYIFLVSIAAAGLVWYFTTTSKSKKSILLVFVLAMVAILTTMKSARSAGLLSESRESTFDMVPLSELSEGVVDKMAMIVSLVEQRGVKFGQSSAAILVFYIPRVLWREKPELLGYTLIRDFGGENPGKYHSVSYTFAGDFYVDFGLYGGLLCCFILGLVFGKIENLTATAILSGNRYAIIASAAFGMTFFAVRSLNTAIIAMSGVVLVGAFIARTIRCRQ